MKTLKKEIDLALNLVKTYPHIREYVPSCWTMFNNDFTEVAEEHLIQCHAKMAYNCSHAYDSYGTKPGVYDQLLTAVPNSSELALDYLNWLIRGPFRSIKDHVHLKTVQDETGAVHYYLHVTGLDVIPSNVVYNFCIASRTPIEWVAMLEAWDKMVQAGVTRPLAFLIAPYVDFVVRMSSSSLSVNQAGIESPLDWKLKFAYPETGHFWLDSQSDWTRVILGDPDQTKFARPYKENHLGARPCNIIWGKGDREFFESLNNKTVKEVVSMFAPKTEEPEVPAELEPVALLDEDFDNDFEDCCVFDAEDGD